MPKTNVEKKALYTSGRVFGETAIEAQARYCVESMRRIGGAVFEHEEARTNCNHYLHSQLGGKVSNGATKTALKSQIVGLRRELLELSKMLDGFVLADD